MSASNLKLLTPAQRKLLSFIIVGSILLLANSLWLAVAGHGLGVGGDPQSLALSYQVMLIAHVVGGALVFLPALFFAFWHLKRALMRKSLGTIWTGLAVLAAMIFLFVSGLFILSESNSRAHQWAFIGHQVAAFLLPLAYWLHRKWSKDAPAPSAARRAMAMIVACFAAMALIHGIERMAGGPSHYKDIQDAAGMQAGELPAGIQPVWRNETFSDRFIPFAPEDAVRKDAPFYPSAATTASGQKIDPAILHQNSVADANALAKEVETKGYADSWLIGATDCERCHQDTVAQWAGSAHRFASFNNPFYSRSIEELQAKKGPESAMWCGGCHDPTVMLSGKMEVAVDQTTVEAQTGLSCMACHAIDRLHGVTGNANYRLQDELGSQYLFANAKGGVQQEIFDALLKAKPTAHRARMKKDFFSDSEFCSTCHKVSLQEPLNGYKWLRGQNDYDSWHNSGVIHNNPMTWYEPKDTKSCQDCHMPLEAAPLGDLAAQDGKVKSHRFLSVNTALPALRGDTKLVKAAEAAFKETLRVDIFAVTLADGKKILAPDFAAGNISLSPGDRIQVDVVVRNQAVGHTFPGGTNDSNEGWVHLKASNQGKTFAESGALDANRHVDPDAHFYRAVLVDKDGQRIARRNAGDIYTPVYSNVIGPSTSDIARYRFTLPKDFNGALELDAKVKWRKFNRGYTEFSFPDEAKRPILPITTIASAQAALPQTSSRPTKSSVPIWIRHNDYGIGQVLDGNIRDALMAFEHVARLVPERVDGWRNQARAHLLEGSFDAAEAMLRKASDIDRSDAKTAFWWGRLQEERGGEDLERAVEAFRRVLQDYPNSRGTWERLGRTYLHLEQWELAAEAFLKVLAIDPEHALAHRKRSEAYAALAEAAHDSPDKAKSWRYASDQAQLAYLRYKVDETAQQVTLSYRSSNPADHRMSQRVVIHKLETR